MLNQRKPKQQSITKVANEVLATFRVDVVRKEAKSKIPCRRQLGYTVCHNDCILQYALSSPSIFIKKRIQYNLLLNDHKFRICRH